MSGAGERCSPLPLPLLPAVLVNPLSPLPTGDVYRQFDLMRLGRELAGASPPHWRTEEEAAAAMRALGNDLEAPAAALMPQIADILADLRASPTVRHAAISGSGATAFALTRDWDAAESLADLLRERHREWWIAEAMLGA
jgi:4-diphosphocytidyl-2-C-methyl-D-erythritol kinase